MPHVQPPPLAVYHGPHFLSLYIGPISIYILYMPPHITWYMASLISWSRCFLFKFRDRTSFSTFSWAARYIVLWVPGAETSNLDLPNCPDFSPSGNLILGNPLPSPLRTVIEFRFTLPLWNKWPKHMEKFAKRMTPSQIQICCSIARTLYIYIYIYRRYGIYGFWYFIRAMAYARSGDAEFKYIYLYIYTTRPQMLRHIGYTGRGAEMYGLCVISAPIPWGI